LTEPRAISNGRYETIIRHACWHAQESKRTGFVRDGIVASIGRAFSAGRRTAGRHRSDRARRHRSDRARRHRPDACTFGFRIGAAFRRSGGGRRSGSRRSGGNATRFDHSTGFDFAGTDFDRSASTGRAAPGGNRNAGGSGDHDAPSPDRSAAIR
jgi:hypothetical protein